MASLPDGALMQRAAAGPGRRGRSTCSAARYGRRVLLLVGPGNNGGDALCAGARLAGRGARGRGAAARRPRPRRAGSPPCAPPAAGPTRDLDDLAPAPDVRRRRHRRHRRPARAAPRRGGRRSRAFAGVPVVAVDVPSRRRRRHRRASTAPHVARRPHRHVRHPQGRPPRRPRRARACGAVHLVDIGLDLARPPAVEALQPDDVRALLPRPGAGRAQVHPRRGRRRAPARAPTPAPRCSPSPAPTRGLVGMVRYVGADGDRRHWSAPRHPEVRRRRPGAGLGRRAPAAATTPGRCSPTARADGVPVVVDADALRHVDGAAAGPACSPRTPASSPRCSASSAPRSRPRRCEHARARGRRAATASCCSRATTRSSPTPTAGSG